MKNVDRTSDTATVLLQGKLLRTDSRSAYKARMLLRLGITAILASCMMTGPLTLLANSTIKPVKLINLEVEKDGVRRTFFGRVTAKQTVDLAFQVPGQLVKFTAIEGDFVAKDAIVAQLDQEPFQLALDRTKATQQQANRSLKRLEQLRGKSATQASVEDASTASVIAGVGRRNAKYALERATLTAPFDAVVASRLVSNFSTVSAGTPVVRLHDMSELQIEIDVPEILFQQTGDNPNLELTALFPASTTLFPLEYREVNAEASRIGQTFKVTLGMSPPKDLLLLPGASVTVFATLLDETAGISVPASAIHKDSDDRTSVMRYVPDSDGTSGVLEKTFVEIRIDEDGGIQLIKGIASGDQIVVSGVQVLADKQRVRPFTSFQE